jgi:hypothetical protein
VANQSYDLRLEAMTGFSTFPGIEFDSSTNRAYFGPSTASSRGSTNVPMFHVPIQPAASLGDWVTSNLVEGSGLPRVTHALGNARAHPLLPVDQVSYGSGSGKMLDHSFLLNDAMWDRYFFSSATATDSSNGLFAHSRGRKDSLVSLFDGSARLTNPRLVPAPGGSGTATDRASALDGMTDTLRAKKIASELAIDGAFNVNSTSVDAWRAVLSSLRDETVYGWGKHANANSKCTPFVRMALPLSGAADSMSSALIRWSGFRTLGDNDISNLAQAIVTEIRKRGAADNAPAFSIGEFVNRRPGSSVHSLAGLLQTAIDNAGLGKDSKAVSFTNIASVRTTGVQCQQAMNGFTGEGAPPMLTQGDLMEGLATVATVRGDTFKIRAYGESVTNGTVMSRAWCEAVVQRIPAYVDPSDPVETKPADLKSTANKLAGRRFVIKSFRWLNPDEV